MLTAMLEISDKDLHMYIIFIQEQLLDSGGADWNVCLLAIWVVIFFSQDYLLTSTKS